MLNRIIATGVLALGVGVAAHVVIGNLFSQRRSRPATEPRFIGDLDFTNEQKAMLALIRRQMMDAKSPLSGEAI